MAQDVASLTHGSAATESRAMESRLQEDPDIGPGWRPQLNEAVGFGISETEATRRADLARHLASVAFPARRNQLVFAAEEEMASSDLIDELRRLPPEEEFVNVQAVWSALGGATEGSHT
ncbi:MAG TPA: DUF2795 domain-containing protein [Acidimicrobiales bacterium]|nr:DUF2795 domain-containing protein [Acidimicrobiales bacterium]